MSESILCPRCGNKLEGDEFFCPKCGRLMSVKKHSDAIESENSTIQEKRPTPTPKVQNIPTATVATKKTKVAKPKKQKKKVEKYDTLDLDDELYEDLDERAVRKLKKKQAIFDNTLFARFLRFLESKQVDTLYVHNIFDKYDTVFLCVILFLEVLGLILLGEVLLKLGVDALANHDSGIVLQFSMCGVVGIFPMFLIYSQQQVGKEISPLLLFALYGISYLLEFLYYAVVLAGPYIVYTDIKRLNGSIELFIPLAIIWIICYLWFYIKIGHEARAYSDWHCALANGNYDYLHSNRFRYHTSLAEQDFEQIDNKIIRTCKRCSIKCSLTCFLWGLLGLIYIICLK